MPALIVLHLLRPNDEKNAELLTALTKALGWTVPLEARYGRVEVPFLGETMDEGMSRVQLALDKAEAGLGVDWTDYLQFSGGSG